MALSILLLCAVMWLWWTRFDELAYHTWADKALIDIGNATSFVSKREEIPKNSFVEVSGILGNKAASISGLRAGSFRYGRFQVRHLLGSKLYVEYDEEKYHTKWNPYTRIDVKGRLTDFGPGSELERVRKFFSDYYHQPVDDEAMLIVVDEAPRTNFIYVALFLVSMALVLLSLYSSIRLLVMPPSSDV